MNTDPGSFDLSSVSSLLPTDVHSDSERPDIGRPALSAMREACELPDDLFGGNRQMRKRSTRWVPKEEKETEANYHIRISRSTVFPFYKDTLCDLAARPFGREIGWGDGEPGADFEEFLRDVDGSGQSFTVFARDTLLSLESPSRIAIGKPLGASWLAARILAMKVQDVMNREPHAVRIVDRLDEVARIMWEQDCGFVPVVDGANTVVGVVTDRDLCMASYMQGAPVATIPVVTVMVQEPVTVGPEDTLTSAMAKMAEAQVHRLPVVDSQDVLLGVLSSNDVIQVAKARPTKVKVSDAMDTLAGITSPRSGVRDFGDVVKAAAGKAPVAKVAAKKAPAKKAPVKKAAAKSASKPAPAKRAAKAPAKAAAKPRKAAAKSPAKTAAKPAKAGGARGVKGKAKA